MLKKKLLLSIMFILLSGTIFTNMLFAQLLTYKNINSGNESNTRIKKAKGADGYIIKETYNKIINIFNTDGSYSTLKWTKTDPVNNTDVILERKGNKIFVSGKLNNEKIDKIFKINELPWYQNWGLGLKEFIKLDIDETNFWSIDPKKLRIAKFTAKKEKTENININGKNIESIYVTVNLTGFLKIFQDGGKMWFRKSNGTCIRLKMNPDNPKEVVDLISEK